MESEKAVDDATDNTAYDNNVDLNSDKSVDKIDIKNNSNIANKCTTDFIDYTLLSLHKNLIDRYTAKTVNNHERVSSDEERTSQCSVSKYTNLGLSANTRYNYDSHNVYNNVVEESKTYGKQLDEKEKDIEDVNHSTISDEESNASKKIVSDIEESEVKNPVNKDKTMLKSIPFNYNKPFRLDEMHLKMKVDVHKEDNVDISSNKRLFDQGNFNETRNKLVQSTNLKSADDTSLKISLSDKNVAVVHPQLLPVVDEDEDILKKRTYSNKKKTKYMHQWDEILQVNQDLAVLNSSIDFESDDEAQAYHRKFPSGDKRKNNKHDMERELGNIKKMKVHDSISFFDNEIALLEKGLETGGIVSNIGNVQNDVQNTKKEFCQIQKTTNIDLPSTSLTGDTSSILKQPLRRSSTEGQSTTFADVKIHSISVQNKQVEATGNKNDLVDQPSSSFNNATDTVNVILGTNRTQTKANEDVVDQTSTSFINAIITQSKNVNDQSQNFNNALKLWNHEEANANEDIMDHSVIINNTKKFWSVSNLFKHTASKTNKNVVEQSAHFNSTVNTLSWDSTKHTKTKTNKEVVDKPRVINNAIKPWSVCNPPKHTKDTTNDNLTDQSATFNDTVKSWNLNYPSKHTETITNKVVVRKSKTFNSAIEPWHLIDIAKGSDAETNINVSDESTTLNKSKEVPNHKEITKTKIGSVFEPTPNDIDSMNLSFPTNQTDAKSDTIDLSSISFTNTIDSLNSTQTEAKTSVVESTSSVNNAMDKLNLKVVKSKHTEMNKDILDHVPTSFVNAKETLNYNHTEAVTSKDLIVQPSSSFINALDTSTISNKRLSIESESTDEESECLVSSSGIIESENSKFENEECSDGSFNDDSLNEVGLKFMSTIDVDESERIKKEKVNKIIEKCSKIPNLTPSNILDYLTEDEIQTLGGEVTEMSQTGFDSGYEVEEIKGASCQNDELMFLIKWKDVDDMDIVPAKLANMHCPAAVIKFYEKNLKFYNHSVVKPLNEEKTDKAENTSNKNESEDTVE